MPYRDSRRPCPSIYHSRIIGPCRYSRAFARRNIVLFFPLPRSLSLASRFVSFRLVSRCDAAASADRRVARRASLLFSPFGRKSLCPPSLVATLFSHDSRNSIQSSRRDLCRTLRSFVYRPFKVVFRGQPARHVFLAVSLYTFLPARNSNSSSPEEPKGEPDALDTRYATYHSESFCVRPLALVMDEMRSRECRVSGNFR